MITQSGIEHPSTLQPTVGPTRLPPPVLVDSTPAFGEMIAALSGQPLLALDTESDSLYRYFFKVGLIQISTPTTDYLVDPLRLPDLTPLGDILADPAVEKVFHAAENDILMLKRDFSFRFANVFDTMLAARILGWKQVSLAALLAQHFGVTLDKRAQLTDWGHRPLDAAQLSYARLDTHYLLPLRDLLIAELRQRRRWREAQDAFTGLPQITYVEKPFDPDGFWRIKGARDLRGSELAVLRQLYLWRDEQARKLDRPPFKVLGDDRLVDLSQRQPARLADLPLNPRQTDLFGKAILAAIAAGRNDPIPIIAASAFERQRPADPRGVGALRPIARLARPPRRRPRGGCRSHPEQRCVDDHRPRRAGHARSVGSAGRDGRVEVGRVRPRFAAGDRDRRVSRR